MVTTAIRIQIPTENCFPFILLKLVHIPNNIAEGKKLQANNPSENLNILSTGIEISVKTVDNRMAKKRVLESPLAELE